MHAAAPVRSWVALAGVFLAVGSLAPSQARADATRGSSGPVIEWPHIAVSAAGLPDGRVLTWSGSEPTTWPEYEQTYSATWDPKTGEFVELFHDGHNMFCAHLALTENGEVFVNGGRNVQNSPWTSLFDYRNDAWTQIESMATGGRWYPTTQVLPSGEIMTSMGEASNFRNPEKWSPERSWEVMNGVDYNAMRTTHKGLEGGRVTWPHLFVTPVGEVFHFWSPEESHFIDTDGVGSVRDATVVADSPDYAPGVAIQFAEGKVLVAGGNQGSWNRVSRDQAFVIDLNGPAPQIMATDPMNFPRRYADLVVLPTGEVLVIGGNTSGIIFSDEGTVYEPEIWNPTTGKWRVGAPMTIPRNYHSTSVLLADGRVLAAGGGYRASDVGSFNHKDGQVFTPPYLYGADGSLAERPSITSAPGFWSHGDDVDVSASPDVARFTMVRMSAITHAVNTDTRFHEVAFTETSPGQYTLSPSPNPNLMLAGYWMLFALDEAGVPSEAHVVRVQRYVAPKLWRYVRLTALSEVNGGVSAAVGELGVFDGNGEPISQSGWTGSASTERGAYVASRAIDGDPNTFWQSASGTPHPHDLVVDLGAAAAPQISGISYLPRGDSEAGRIADYEVRLSADGTHWSGVFASGTFENITVSSGGAGASGLTPSRYRFGTLATGQRLYVDRGFTYTSIPAALDGLTSVRTANDDKRANVNVRFQLAEPRTVYVGYDMREPGTASWLQSWEQVPGWRIDSTDTDFRVYRKDFPAGQVSLGRSEYSSGGRSMYIVAISNGQTTQAEEVFFDESFPLTEVEMVGNAAAATGAELSYTATPGPNLAYQWSFGDGTPPTAFSPDPSGSHTFTTPGRYNVVVTVRDLLTGQEQSFNVTQIVHDAAIDPADDALRRLSSSSVVFHPARDEIWNVNPDNGTATVIAASTLVKLGEVPVGPDPRSLAVAPDGRVWVVSKEASEIHVIDPASQAVTKPRRFT
jgi:hypothetical protein